MRSPKDSPTLPSSSSKRRLSVKSTNVINEEFSIEGSRHASASSILEEISIVEKINEPTDIKGTDNSIKEENDENIFWQDDTIVIPIDMTSPFKCNEISFNTKCTKSTTCIKNVQRYSH